MMDLYPKLLLSTGLSFFFKAPKSSEIDLFILNNIATIQMHATCYNQNNVRTKALRCQWTCKARPNYGNVGVNTQHSLYIELTEILLYV
jgi:hypothetical protein